MCNRVAESNKGGDDCGSRGDLLRRHPNSTVPNVRLLSFERQLRHPACPLVGAAAVAALAFILVSARALPLLGGILATLALGCVGPWIASRGVTAAVAWDRRRARVGEPLTATIAWRSILPWWRPQVSLGWPDAEPATQGLGGSVAVVPRRRGRYPRVAPAIETNQPFGIFTARRTLAMPAAAIVWPARADVRMPFGLVAVAGAGREMSERITGQSGDPIGVRDYRAGDSVRSIHWAHTARRDALIVRERPGTAGAMVRLIVDHRFQRSTSDGSAGADADPDRTLDALVGIAFAIIESWRPHAVAFELAWPGRTPLDPRTPAEFAAMLDELACLEPYPAADIEPGPACGRPRPVDLEVVLTTPPGRAAADRSALAPGPMRLWIIVGGSTASAARPGRGRGETVVHVPLEPDPIAAVDAAFAGLGHDPDTSPRSRVAGQRRSHAPT
jgi:uncharacterized protein (DUF58 family)